MSDRTQLLTPSVALPSGEQVEIRAGDQRVVVVEVGAGLRRYTAGDHDVLDGYAEDEMATDGRGQVLLPWPNRIHEGTYEFAGRKHRLALTEPEAGNAIHGLVRWADWWVRERDEGRAVLEYTLHPQPGYPFSLELGIEYSLTEDGLRVTTTATNVGREACPFGGGAHPYLTVGTETLDTAILRAPGRTVLIADAGLRVDGGEYDFRRSRAIGATKLDHTFTDLERGDDGLARVELLHPDGGPELALWIGESYHYLQLFTGDPLPGVDRRSLAVEPMTCPPNAFRTGVGLIVLEPGESATGEWGIEVRP